MIYILEDDKSILELILYALKSQGIESEGFSEPSKLKEALKKIVPDVLILDIMLPEQSGFDILEDIKKNEKTKNISILLLSALNSEFDKVKGLDLGADDYITKPFGVMELLARIRALLRRNSNNKDKNKRADVVFNGLSYSTINHSVKIKDKKVELTLKEFEILGVFLHNMERAFSREELLELLWDNYNIESRTVDIHIKTLRQKLGNFGEHIKTVRGVGYKFVRII